MSNESLVIYSMNKVGRLVPISNKMILRDITLGFNYGAKTPALPGTCARSKCAPGASVGVLGFNGAGKSMLQSALRHGGHEKGPLKIRVPRQSRISISS